MGGKTFVCIAALVLKSAGALYVQGMCQLSSHALLTIFCPSSCWWLHKLDPALRYVVTGWHWGQKWRLVRYNTMYNIVLQWACCIISCTACSVRALQAVTCGRTEQWSWQVSASNTMGYCHGQCPIRQWRTPGNSLWAVNAGQIKCHGGSCVQHGCALTHIDDSCVWHRSVFSGFTVISPAHCW